jgi:pilus assembly protein CpaC
VTRQNRQLQQITIGVLSSALLLLFPLLGQTQERPRITLETHTPQKVRLVLGESLVINSPVQITRLSLATPEIADAVVLSPRQFYLTAKAVGGTHLTLWDERDRVISVFDVEVTPNVTRLKEKLQEILPGEDIQVTATNDTVTLYGQVSSTVRLSQALAIAAAFMPEKPEKVINLLQVAGVQQVMLEVRVAEMARSLTKRLGFNFTALSSGVEFGVSLLSNLTSLGTMGTSGLLGSTVASPAINAITRFQAGNVTVTTFIDALKENGLVKILAEPTLVTLSGQEARFLAGGEFPIPVAQSFNAITVEFKTFGVGLVFTPTVLSDNKISMRVAPEVSELDFTNAVNFSGFVVPGLTTRRASTVIALADGQSLAIAGLLNERVRESITRFPLLGDVPILGALFRSSQYQKSETELIIIVTPHLVRPLDLAKQTLPTDQFVEPNDFEFYLLGKLEGQGAAGRRGGKLDGKFGYIVP